MGAKLFKVIFWLSLITGLFTQPLWAESLPLSEQTKISVITCAPGEELYAVFGHSAIRIQDPSQGMDEVYNYGTFDFRQNYFLLKFSKGNLGYFLSTVPYRYFKNAYQREERAMTEQVLNLTPNQTQKIYDFLQENLKPENKAYRYQFFADNCATRIIDVLEETLGQEDLQVAMKAPEDEHYLDCIAPYLDHQPWAEFGIHLLMGKNAYKLTTARDQAFLPDELALYLAQMSYNNAPLVQETNVLYRPDQVETPTANWLDPFKVVLALLILQIALTLWQWKKPFRLLWTDYVFYTTTGLLGLIIVALDLFSLHQPLQENLNLLWALPTHLLMLLYRKGSTKILIRVYFLITMCFEWGFVALILVGFRDISLTIMLLALGMAVRHSFLYYKLQSQKRIYIQQTELEEA